MKSILTIFILLNISSNVVYSKNIIIIGAGVSGLAAANKLQTAGHVVTLLEGRDRAGGRVWSDTTLGYPVDIGASWIHGINGNVIYELSKTNQAETVIFDYGNAKCFSSSLSPNQLQGVESKISTARTNFIQFLSETTTNAEEDISISSLLNQYTTNKALDSENQTYLNNYVFSEVEIEFGTKAENLSSFYFSEGVRLRGEDALMPKGYITIFDPLIKKLNINIKLNTIVESITQTGNTVTIGVNGGNSFSADYVIVTVPLGVLKANKIQFSPELSQAKSRSIKSLGFGSMEKIVVEFTEAFWDNFNILRIVNNPVTTFGWAVNLHKVLGKTTLLFLVGGEGKYNPSIYNKTKPEIEEDLVNLLKNLFPGKNIAIKKSVITKWKEDQFSFGSYTSFATNSTPSMITEFSKNEGLVYFAGEHTHQQYFSTVHGAFLSGERAADQITAHISTVKRFLDKKQTK